MSTVAGLHLLHEGQGVARHPKYCTEGVERRFSLWPQGRVFRHDGVIAQYEEVGRQWLKATYVWRWTGNEGRLHALVHKRI